MNIQELPDVPELIRTEPRIEELIQVKTGFPVSPEFRAVLDKLTGFDQSFFTFTKENLEQTKFKVIYLTENYVDYDDFDCMTEYEKSFREEGVAIHRIVLEK